jgi:hypothetical protein
VTEALRSIGVIRALLGGAGVLSSITGPLKLRESAPWMAGWWRRARKWGAVLLAVGVALLLASLL